MYLTLDFCMISVALLGGILAVAGQFKNWQFGAYAMYPCLHTHTHTHTHARAQAGLP